MKYINVTIDGKTHSTPEGTKLSSLLQATHSHVNMPCGGKGNCGKCRVTVSGEVSAPTDAELKYLSADELLSGVRLACLTCAVGDCTVTTASAATQQICLDTDLPDTLESTLARPVFDKYGVAVDIGTTTVAACLYNREWDKLTQVGVPNPQAVWGADVVSRMECALRGHAEDLAEAITKTVNQVLVTLAQNAGISVEEIDTLVITGNTVMLHLLTKTSTEPLTHAPFAAKRLFGEWVTARELDLTALQPTAKVYLMPCVSAFVGGDLVASLMACDFCYGRDTRLLADVGTNGEMALWHKEKLYVCSTAASPAFEGAGIAMGMAGSVGAVDRVTLCNGQMLAHVIGEIAPVGICGSGMVDSMACLLDSDLMDETGLLEQDPTPIAPPVVLTQSDIRTIQLAKSAVCAGLLSLMHVADLAEESVTTLFVAGGFGSYLNLRNAGRIGLLPPSLTSKAKVLGNAALTGASMVLLDGECVTYAERISKQALCVDLATNAYFAETFMQGTMFLKKR